MSNNNLRLMNEHDLAQVLLWRNHPDVRRYMYTQHEISMAEHKKWFKESLANSAKTLLVFEYNDVPTGFVNLTRNSINDQSATWGFYLAPDSKDGMGSELANAALSYAFKKLKLHKLIGEVLVSNKRSINFHQRLGFQEEGRLRDGYFDGSAYHDIVIFGLLNKEWQCD